MPSETDDLSAVPARKKWRKLAARICLLLAFGSTGIMVALEYRASRRPHAAPVSVQVSGHKIIKDELSGLANTAFGQSERGKILSERALLFLDQGRIVFSDQLGSARGLTWNEVLGQSAIYIKVMAMNNDAYLHQTHGQIMEVLFHETVHSFSRKDKRTSLDEECDAFAAGLCVMLAVEGKEEPELLMLDGVPLSDFIAKNYPDIGRSRDYQPVSQTRDWLSRRTGVEIGEQ